MSTLCQDHRDGRSDNELKYWARQFRVVRYYDPSMTFEAFLSFDIVQRNALVQSALSMVDDWRSNPRIWDMNSPPIVTDWRADHPTDWLDTELVSITTFHKHNQN